MPLLWDTGGRSEYWSSLQNLAKYEPDSDLTKLSRWPRKESIAVDCISESIGVCKCGSWSMNTAWTWLLLACFIVLLHWVAELFWKDMLDNCLTHQPQGIHLDEQNQELRYAFLYYGNDAKLSGANGRQFVPFQSSSITSHVRGALQALRLELEYHSTLPNAFIDILGMTKLPFQERQKLESPMIWSQLLDIYQ